MPTESTKIDSFRFFDPEADFGIVERNLPHWMQARTVCFITWRTWDSMPANVVKEWHDERTVWLSRHRIDPKAANLLKQLPTEQRREYHRMFSERWESLLDNCHGACPLRNCVAADIVRTSLLHFDNVRYLMTDFVVMPNHVHLLAAFADEQQMLGQCESWKHFTAVKLNKMLGRSGRFWEPESFDHLVRTEEQWRYLRDYIMNNPRRANLREGEYIHYSRPF